MNYGILEFITEAIDAVLVKDEYLFIGKEFDSHIVQYTIPDCRAFKRFLNGKI